MGKALEKKQPLPLWRRILLGLLLVLMVLLSVLVLASYLAGRQLGAEIIKISRAGEPLTFSDLRPDLSDSGDAAPYYAEALAGIRPDSLENLAKANVFYRKNIIFLPASQFPDNLRERITKNLTVQQPILKKLDTGADFPLSYFDIGIEQGSQVYISRSRRVQTAAFLLSLRTLDLILHGDDDATVNSTISLLKMIRIFDIYPTMVLYLAKARLVRLACEDIRLLLEHGRPTEKSLAKLQKVLSQTMPVNIMERVFLAERVYQMEMARNLIPGGIVSRLLQENVPDLPERLSMPSTFWARLRIRRQSIRYFRDMARLIADARYPWPKSLDAIVGNTPESAEPPPSSLLANGVVFIRLTGGTLAFVRCTILAIAVERYRRSHGELPDSLDDLFPAYISSIPLDPFTGKKLLYSHDEETYVIYSVGINRRDDSGSIVPKAGQKSPQDLGLRIPAFRRKPE